jgi:hypothetical protein
MESRGELWSRRVYFVPVNRPLLPLSEHQNLDIFSECLENPKTSRIAIVRSLITNIDLLSRFYDVVVMKWWFERLRAVGG